MTFLEQILHDTRSLVAQRKAVVPVRALEERPSFMAPTLSLAKVLRDTSEARRPAIIAEVKKASPSAGVLRRDFRAADIARQYKAAGAAAISVLTEPLHFKGSLDDLAQVRFATDLPLLRKDFIVDEYQLIEARAYGADAVLLIAAALDRAELRDLHQTATALGLTALVELHDESELDLIDVDAMEVVGVNNRDLATFEVDTERAEKIFRQLPGDIVRIAESGFRAPEDLVRIARAGIDGVLIGEAFMRATDPGRSLRRLRAETATLLQTPLRLAC
jgi:indole-3-glycerol phosphate synthase